MAFATWPPQFATGKVFALVGANMPPPPEGAAKPDPPPQWGDVGVVRQRLGDRVRDLGHDTGTMRWPVLSPQHYRVAMEQTSGPIRSLEKLMAAEPSKLAAFRAELDAIAAQYFTDNAVRMDYLLTRATRK